MKMTKIQRHTTERIVTSGYDDRWLKCESIVTISVVGVNEETAKCEFHSDSDARDFLLATGMEWDEVWPIVSGASTTIVMFGRLLDNSYRSVVVTPEQMRSVRAFLRVRNPRGYTQDAIDKALVWLNANPLPEELLAIVQGQIAKCDRENTRRWGYSNGQQAC